MGNQVSRVDPPPLPSFQLTSEEPKKAEDQAAPTQTSDPETARLAQLVAAKARANALHEVNQIIEQRSTATTPAAERLSKDLSGSQLTWVAWVPSSFPHLVKLHLCYNKLESIHELLPLVHLTSLDVSNNSITSLPIEMGGWASLTQLNLRSNKLVCASELLQLKELRIVDLSFNQLTTLPLALVDLPHIKDLECAKNPLLGPFSSMAKYLELTDLGLLDDVGLPDPPLEVLRSIKLKNAWSWKKVKVVVCGRAGVGKTHLVHRLQHKSYPHAQSLSTDGLLVHELRESDMGFYDSSPQLTILDLGGQEVFYPTHRFFLGGNPIFLVTSRSDNPDQQNIEFWIRTAITHAYPRHPHIILVLTYADKTNAEDQRCLTDQMIRRFSKLTRIKGIFYVALTRSIRKSGVESLREFLREEAGSHPAFGSPVPSLYHDVAKMVLAQRGNHQVMQIEEFRAKFLSNDPTNCFVDLATFFNDTGVIIWFNWPETRNLVILDPQWLANVFAGVVSFSKSWPNGVVTRAHLSQAWMEYDPKLHPGLIKMLEQFEILHKLTDTSWAIPCMLSDQPPPEYAGQFELFGSLAKNANYLFVSRRFEFSFVPLGFFSKLLVRLMQLPKVDTLSRWLTGALVSDRPSSVDSLQEQVLLNLDYSSGTLRVMAAIPHSKHSVSLFVLISHSIESFLRSSHRSVQIKSSATCPHCLDANWAVPTRFPTDLLCEVLASGGQTVTCPVENTPRTVASLAPDLCLVHLKVFPPSVIGQLVEIAKGAFGKVSKGTLLATGETVAVKEIAQTEEMPLPQTFAEWHNEAFLLGQIDHPNLLKLYGINFQPMYFVTEYCEADYNRFLRRSGSSVGWSVKLKLLCDIAKGMEHLQNRSPPIVHRDLRSPNVFLKGDPSDPQTLQAKVGDLGLSRQGPSKLTEALDTWEWLAPEVIRFHGTSYDTRSDIYSFAMLIWQTIHPTAWPFELNPEFRTSQVRAYSASELDSDPNLITEIKEGVGECNVTVLALPDGSARVTTRKHQPMSIKRAIINSDYRPLITEQAIRATPPQLVALMTACWNSDPAKRPLFSSIVLQLDLLLSQLSNNASGTEKIGS